MQPIPNPYLMGMLPYPTRTRPMAAKLPYRGRFAPLLSSWLPQISCQLTFKTQPRYATTDRARGKIRQVVNGSVPQTQTLLGQIPTLAAELPGFLTGAGAEPESRTAGPAASRPPLDLAILDLVDGRQLEWWVLLAIDEMFEVGIEATDPPSSRRRSIDADCRWLAQNCEWIADHNDDFHTDIRRIHGAYQHAAGHTLGPKILCPKCGNRAFIDGQWMICSEVENHARTIRDIEHELRYQPAETTDQITRRFAITPDRLWQWRHRRKLAPARKDGRTLLWWPWDVFCLLNPQVAEAIAARDDARTA